MLSVHECFKQGIRVEFGLEKVNLYVGANIVATDMLKNRLYVLSTSITQNKKKLFSDLNSTLMEPNSEMQWHRCLGHLNFKSLDKLIEQGC